MLVNNYINSQNRKWCNNAIQWRRQLRRINDAFWKKPSIIARFQRKKTKKCHNISLQTLIYLYIIVPYEWQRVIFSVDHAASFRVRIYVGRAPNIHVIVSWLCPKIALNRRLFICDTLLISQPGWKTRIFHSVLTIIIDYAFFLILLKQTGCRFLLLKAKGDLPFCFEFI